MRFSPEYKLIDTERTKAVIEALYRGVEFFGVPFLEIYARSLEATDSGINPHQAVNKLRRCYNLCRLFLETVGVPGDIAECGVFRGSTARLLVELMTSGRIVPTDKKFKLFDSFEGLPGESDEDAHGLQIDGEGTDRLKAAGPRRFSDTSVEAVRHVFKQWPWIEAHKGWIPEVFQGHGDSRYSFVHVDVDLYRSTYDCLEYFVPRMNSGGMILCDDYLSVRFPGAKKAWDLYCTEHRLKFVTLDNYQAVLVV